MSCREFFEQLPSGDQVNERAAIVAAEKPSGCCEQESVSSYSKGPVRDAEYLLRGVYSPIHIDPVTGAVIATLFSDADDKGLSCDRSMVPGVSEDARSRGEERARSIRTANPQSRVQDFVGVVYSTAAAVRGIMTTGDVPHRAFHVYDTANKNNGDHADVFQDQRPGDAARKRLRKRLLDAFTRTPE
jgi:hypothetical protein